MDGATKALRLSGARRKSWVVRCARPSPRRPPDSASVPSARVTFHPNAPKIAATCGIVSHEFAPTIQRDELAPDPEDTSRVRVGRDAHDESRLRRRHLRDDEL